MPLLYSEKVTLACEAIAVAKALFQSRPLPTGAKEKVDGPRDLVTDLDIAIERAVVEVLSKSGLQIVGEELNPSVSPNRHDPFWVIDPIDGTVNFAHNMHYFGTAIGLAKQNDSDFEPLLGAFLIPTTDEFFYTPTSQSAVLNGEPLSLSELPLKESLIVACFTARGLSDEGRFNQYRIMDHLNQRSRGVLRLGSATGALCYTAASKLQATYGIELPLWDVLPGVAIARAAGQEVFLQPNTTLDRLTYVVGAPEAVNEIKTQLKRYQFLKDTF
jgi:myo-inositol-1(or 4)-monophosphatase